MTSFERSVAHFKTAFNAIPTWVSHAPGRVNLIGEHVDYNDGFVLPAAIDRRLSIAAALVSSPGIEVYSEQEAQQVSFSLEPAFSPRGKWTDYVVGVMDRWIQLGASPVGLQLSIASDVPVGAGLSSSAALEMAVATLLEEVWKLRLGPVQKALACQQVEAEFVGMPCGIMDQFIVGLGKKDHLLSIDCQTNSHDLIRVDEDFPNLLIINSNVRHALTDGGYATRRAQCESALARMKQDSWRNISMSALEDKRGILGEIEFRRGRHVVTEIDRTRSACDCIQRGDLRQLGRLLYESHLSLRDDYEVSCRELDWIVERMQNLGEENGVYGCRITGGGFGGCAVSLVKSENVQDIVETIGNSYQSVFGITPEFFVTHPSDGCQLDSL